MSWDGMYPQHSCKDCGKPLNNDGGHPAELYAGTYTGLCYTCEKKEAHEVKKSPHNICILMSHPPHCPSWRRSREHYWWWPECTNSKCQKGRIWISRSFSQGGPSTIQCPDCKEKYDSIPEIKEQNRVSERRRLACHYWCIRLQKEYEKRLKKAEVEKEDTDYHPIADQVISESPSNPLDKEGDNPLPIFPKKWSSCGKKQKEIVRKWEELNEIC